MREYECGLVFRPDLSAPELEEIHGKYEKIMKEEGGEIIFKDDWGVKKLAYPIKDHFKGNYVFYDLASMGPIVKEIERIARIDENVLRFLTVKLADSVDVEMRKEEIVKDREQERQEELERASKHAERRD